MLISCTRTYVSDKGITTADHNSNFTRLRPGAHGSMQANKQAALVQELVRRQHVSCPAHPAFREPHEDHVGNGIHSDDAPHMVSAPSAAAAARLESYFASPSFDRIAATHTRLAQAPGHSIPSDCFMSAGSWADFCIKHDLTHARHTAKDNQLSSRMRHIQLRAAFADTNVFRAVAKDPLLLSYCPTTLIKHMQHLQLLFGNSEASAMVAKMPTLLHYRRATLSAKLDGLYDLLPQADVSKVKHDSQSASCPANFLKRSMLSALCANSWMICLSACPVCCWCSTLHFCFASANLHGLTGHWHFLVSNADVISWSAMLMLLQMVIRSPFLLGLSSQTLAIRFQALQAAFPEGNVQRMIEYYPSLLEVNAACQTTTTAALRHQMLC